MCNIAQLQRAIEQRLGRRVRHAEMPELREEIQKAFYEDFMRLTKPKRDELLWKRIRAIVNATPSINPYDDPGTITPECYAAIILEVRDFLIAASVLPHALFRADYIRQRLTEEAIHAFTDMSPED